VRPSQQLEVAEQLAHATRGAGYISLLPGRRRRWRRELPPSVHFDDKQADEVLSDEADLRDVALILSPRREALARTVLLIATEIATAWTLRSYWIGDALRSEAPVTATELADLIRHSALDRHVLYRVEPISHKQAESSEIGRS
jgi:hypothetical protein